MTYNMILINALYAQNIENLTTTGWMNGVDMFTDQLKHVIVTAVW